MQYSSFLQIALGLQSNHFIFTLSSYNMMIVYFLYVGLTWVFIILLFSFSIFYIYHSV